MKKLQKLLSVVLCVLVVFSVCACTNSGDTATQATTSDAASATAAAAESTAVVNPDAVSTKDMLTVVINADIGNFCPAGATSFTHVQVVRQIFETLVARDENMNIVPWLADSWEWANETELVMHLHEGATFTNGEPFTAADVLFTFQYIQDTQNGGIDYVRNIDLANSYADGDYTLHLILSTPTTNLVELLENPMTGIMCKSAVTADETFATVESAIGTGPYIPTVYNVGDSITMVANENYWKADAMPKIKNLIFRFVTDSSSRVIEAESGNADIVFDLPASDVEALAANTDINYIQTTTGGTTFLCLNCDFAPFQDIRVRQAVAYAINREAAVAAAYQGYGGVQKSIFADGVKGAPDTSEYICENDTEKTKALLTEAGYPNGFDFTLTVTNTDQNRVNLAEALQAQLAQVGIKVTVDALAPAAQMPKCLGGEADACLYGFTATTFEAQRQLIRWLPGSTDFKIFNWTDQDYIDLVNQAMVTTDEAARYELFGQAATLLTQACTAIPMWTMQINAVLQNDVQGFYFMRSFQHHLFQYVYFN